MAVEQASSRFPASLATIAATISESSLYTTLPRGKAVASVPAEEEELWCGTTRAIPSPRPDQRRAAGSAPSEVTEATAAEVAADFLRNLGLYPTGSLSGRGIVTLWGTPTFSVRLGAHRGGRLGCTLPVQICACRPRQRFHADASSGRSEPPGVSLRRRVSEVLAGADTPSASSTAWKLKPFSPRGRRSRGAPFLDADNVRHDPHGTCRNPPNTGDGCRLLAYFGRL